MIEPCRDAFLHYLESVKGASAHTVKAYAEDLGQFVEFAQTQGVTDIHAADPALLRAFLAHLDSLGLARASRARKTASLRSFFSYLTRQSLLRALPPSACGASSTSSVCQSFSAPMRSRVCWPPQTLRHHSAYVTAPSWKPFMRRGCVPGNW